MKNIKFVYLVAGVVLGGAVGWQTARMQSRRELLAITEIYSPEVQEYIAKSFANGEMLARDFSHEEITRLLSLSKKVATSSNSMLFGRALQAYLSLKFIRNDEREKVEESSISCLKLFLEMYESGVFEGDIDDESVVKFAEATQSLLDGMNDDGILNMK